MVSNLDDRRMISACRSRNAARNRSHRDDHTNLVYAMRRSFRRTVDSTWKLTKVYHRAGVISMILCFALGIANIITVWRPVIVIFAALCLYVPHPIWKSRKLIENSASSFVILFIEVPLLLRICPTSDKFDGFIRRFSTNYTRAAIYLIMSTVQWLSLVTHQASSLIAAAIVLLITASFYGIAALRKDQFMSSKTLGGQGVAQMIV
jgi:hypothetical protein